MSGMDRLTDPRVTDEALERTAASFPDRLGGAAARELLARRRASQAAPAGCGYPCGYDCNGACFQASTAPSDELAEIDAMLMEGQGDDDGPQILPDFEPGWSVAAKVEACLHLLEKRRDVIAAPAPCQACNGSGDASEKGRIEVCCPCKGTGKAPAPSDGLRKAAMALCEAYRDGMAAIGSAFVHKALLDCEAALSASPAQDEERTMEDLAEEAVKNGISRSSFAQEAEWCHDQASERRAAPTEG